MQSGLEKMHSESIDEIAKALVKFQFKVKNVVKDKENPFYKSKYADLAGLIETIKEPLSENDLCYIQYNETINEKIYLTTQLLHISGQWFKNRIELIFNKREMQSMGSAITFARRYGLFSVTGTAQEDEDDDGNAALSSDEGSVKIKLINEVSSLNQLISLAEELNLSKERMKELIKTRYGRERSIDLKEEECVNLIQFLRNGGNQ